MKTLKLIIFGLLLIPFCAGAQSKAKSSKTPIYDNVESKYPLYNDKEAAELWAKWKTHGELTQDNYSRIIDLCDASFTYLSQEIEIILQSTSSMSHRTKKASDLDMGITSNMSNFARTMALRMQKLGASGDLTPENQVKVVAMLQKKKTYMDLNQALYHPN